VVSEPETAGRGRKETLVGMKSSALDLESRLEGWLVRDISILDPGLLVIGQQVPTDFGGFIDLLCIDETGDVVIVELKRDKTPREVLAQVLDYASWVVDLTAERLREIADDYIHRSELVEADDLDDLFQRAFGSEVPDTLNSETRMFVVGSAIDESSERIIKYLSDKHGLRINAATFQYFRTANLGEIIARVFVIEPADVDRNARTKGSSKRRPNLSFEELEHSAKENGVSELYGYAVSVFGAVFPRKRTTATSLGFEGNLHGGRRVVISLIPRDSSDGRLGFQIYKTRFAQLANIPVEKVVDLLPSDHKDWSYYLGASADWQGYSGLITGHDDIDRIA
jgi:hypothetical protein